MAEETVKTNRRNQAAVGRLSIAETEGGLLLE